jgi:ribosomal protein S18 acetylase RimI-like enzyme
LPVRDSDEGTPYRLREAAKDDREFLWRLHRATMKDYVGATWGWDERFQREFFDERFDPGKLRIIVVEGEDAGMISTARCEEAMELVSIRVAPAFQGRGIGARLVKEFLAQAREEGRPVELSVLKANPRAKKLNERLGFGVTSETETHYRMSSSV